MRSEDDSEFNLHMLEVDEDTGSQGPCAERRRAWAFYVGVVVRNNDGMMSTTRQSVTSLAPNCRAAQRISRIARGQAAAALHQRHPKYRPPGRP